MAGFMDKANARRPAKVPKDKDGCQVEVKRTKNGKKILVGKGCTREQIQMIKESGQLNLND